MDKKKRAEVYREVVLNPSAFTLYQLEAMACVITSEIKRKEEDHEEE